MNNLTNVDLYFLEGERGESAQLPPYDAAHIDPSPLVGILLIRCWEVELSPKLDDIELR